MNKQNQIYLGIGIVAIILIATIVMFSAPKGENEVIKIGAILPLTGPDSSNGISAKNGLILAMEEINSKAELNNNHKIELIFEDYKGNPSEAVTSYQNIKSINNPVAIFILGSPASMAIAPLANNDEIFLFSISSASAYSSLNDFTYRIVPSAKQEGEDTSSYILNNLGIGEVGVVYLNNEYGVSTKNAFISQYTQNKRIILFEESFNQEDTDFRTQILKIKSKDAKVIYLSSWGKHAGLFIKQASELGLVNITYICTQACLNKDLIASGGEFVEGVVFPFSYMKPESEFINEFEERFNEKPIQFSERMYDSLQILKKVIDSCDSINKECIKGKLDSQVYTGTSIDYSYDYYGDVNDNLAWYSVKNGEFVLVKR